jgi:SAM-dependent methyltransferase
MPNLLSQAASLKNAVQRFTIDKIKRRRLAAYLKSNRQPWTRGYDEYREQFLRNAIQDEAVLNILRDGQPLPEGYGFRLDARVVEIPWVLSRAGQRAGTFLDAGSALNYEFVLRSAPLRDKRVTIMTLAPEGDAFWRLGVSYVFGDLRELDFREELFDAVACISTIEHVGMDNTMYAGEKDIAQRGDPREFLNAVAELKRVLKPGGALYISFPFGRYENHGWFQQFDAELVDTLVAAFEPSLYTETIFKYEPTGWILSNRSACADCQFFDVHTSKYFDPNSSIEYPPDFPAGERALACLELIK